MNGPPTRRSSGPFAPSSAVLTAATAIATERTSEVGASVAIAAALAGDERQWRVPDADRLETVLQRLGAPC